MGGIGQRGLAIPGSQCGAGQVGHQHGVAIPGLRPHCLQQAQRSAPILPLHGDGGGKALGFRVIGMLGQEQLYDLRRAHGIARLPPCRGKTHGGGPVEPDIGRGLIGARGVGRAARCAQRVTVDQPGVGRTGIGAAQRLGARQGFAGAASAQQRPDIGDIVARGGGAGGRRPVGQSGVAGAGKGIGGSTHRPGGAGQHVGGHRPVAQSLLRTRGQRQHIGIGIALRDDRRQHRSGGGIIAGHILGAGQQGAGGAIVGLRRDQRGQRLGSKDGVALLQVQHAAQQASGRFIVQLALGPVQQRTGQIRLARARRHHRLHHPGAGIGRVQRQDAAREGKHRAGGPGIGQRRGILLHRQDQIGPNRQRSVEPG